MPVVPVGTVNLAALWVPGVIIQIVPPQNIVFNGLPTNVLGLVGTASWGPVNQPITVGGGYTQYAARFGQMQNRKYDIGTQFWLSFQQGAQNYRIVRVTDGTDVAASIAYAASETFATETVAGTAHVGDVLTLTFTPTVGSPIVVTFTMPATPTTGQGATGLAAAVNANAALVAAGFTAQAVGSVVNVNAPGGTAPGTGWTSITPTVTGGGATTTLTGATSSAATTKITFNSKYTGSLGNTASVQISAGSAANSWKATVQMTGRQPEIFNNITGAGNAFWVNLANAITNGVPAGLQGPSGIISATAGAGGGAPVAATYALTGGTDGAGALTSATLIGADTIPRTGMYALRGQLIAGMMVLCDCDDTTQWSTVVTFCGQEGCYGVVSGPVGDTIANAVTTKATAGIDTYTLKVMLGDWIYFNDPVNGRRLVSPSGIVGGLLSNLSPEQSSLNKPVNGIVGTQRSINATTPTYSDAEKQTLAQAGIDVIANPSPGLANVFAVQLGQNASSSQTIWGDNYTRMTNFVAYTLLYALGQFLGKPILPPNSQTGNGVTLAQIRATVQAFLRNMFNLGMIGAFDDPGDGSRSFQVVCDTTNNTANNIGLGNVFVSAKVVYLSILRDLVVSLEGGQTVSIQTSNVQLANGPSALSAAA